MPQLERWDRLPEGVRQHLIERMRDRAISISDLNQLRLRVETRPEVSDGDWYKDFGSFRILPQKRSWSEAKLQRVKRSDHSASVDLWVLKTHRPAFSTSSIPVFAALIARLRPHLWARA